MSVKMNLWSMTLLPGEKYPIYIRKDFQITNAALAEELASTDGRSVVKVTHNPINPARFDDSDSDSDFDSELGDELDDEFEIGSDEDEEMEAEVEGEGKEAVEGEDDDEDEDDEEEDSEFDEDDEVEETSVICALTAGKIEQASLNLTFVEGEVVMFEVTGENAVHLLGNYINQFPDEDSEDDSDYDSEEDDFSDFEDEELDTEEEEAVSNVISKPKAKITEIAEPKPTEKKRKAETLESPAPKATAATTTTTAAAAEGEMTKTQKKKLAKKQKLDAAPAAVAAAAPAAAPKKEEAKKESSKPSKRTLPSGLVIEDTKVGSGPVAKTGKKLGMRYIGKLDTGKQFDANTSGKPFSFMLGRGEVISGWDQGLVGMAVGGERRLTIPPQLAYGNQKIPGIPKNSTLTFEVKLVSIN